ncbi:MAG: IS1634 family transposase, partial [Methanosarcinales archaeon]|nr:IS1634 family transposase [Methanosarcinales archaeon]
MTIYASIGTILAVKEKYKKLDFQGVFQKYKNKGRNINSLIQALLSYKLTENLSISKASGWINRGEVLETFNLK